MSNTVAEKKATDVAVSNLSSLLEEEAGAGLENFTTEDMQIPFIRILQALSPQLNKQDSMYIKGAEQGDIFNTVSQTVYRADEGVLVVPCFFEKKFLEFGLRSSGGGFIRELASDDRDIGLTTREGAAEMLPSGNELVRTHQHVVMAMDYETQTGSPAILDMKKTQLNDQGSWYNYKIERVTETTKALETMMLEARTMYQSFRKGDIQTASAPAEEMQNASKTDEIPF